MSRICVKNIPKYVAEDRLRDFFSQKGEITDAKIMRTSDRKSRQFAFVGFRTGEEAEEAIRFFNNSYLDTCRITCEIARKVGDPDIPRPWSKHSAKKDGTLDTDKNVKENSKPGNLSPKRQVTTCGTEKTIKVSPNTDPQLEEFLHVMQPRVNSKLWANDTPGAFFSVSKHKKDERDGSQSYESSKTQLAKTETNAAKDSDKDNKSDPIVTGTDENSTDKLLEAAKVEDISDMDYFKSRVKKKWSDSESDDERNSKDEERSDIDSKGDHITQLEDDQIDAGGQSNVMKEDSPLEEFEDEKSKHEKPSSALNDKYGQVLDTGRLFVRNLPYMTNEDELLELFSKYGDVSNVHLVVDKDTKRSKGIGYVLYTLPESAVRALEELDNSIFQGRLLHVLPAKPQHPSSDKVESNPADGRGVKSFKQQREQQRKASEVSGDTKSWNSLFMRPDTVVENIARKYGVSKSDLLDRDADDLAVRIALGETHVIAETKKYLSNGGINAAALEELATKKTENSKRSNHVVLVKNLPYGCSEGDLANMFGQFGSLDKIVLPPTKALALVIFLEPAEARRAFRGLAYKRYKDAPLYLEWAPSNILSPKTALETDIVNNVVGEKEIKRVLLEQAVEAPENDLDPDRVESRSVFVKNLNFKTSEETLRKHFGDNMKKGRIQSVKIKKHVKNGKNVSMGYGFIEFDSVETTTDVCRDLQGTILDAHALILQLCHSKKDDKTIKKVDKDKSSTKLIVRNVAFEATEKDLRQLFSPFGQIRSIRLPMKFGSHRGFAFVEYIAKQEARNALQALASTHLYGRHLVLERAKEGESLEELRARTAAQFSDGQNGLQKLSKKRKHMAILDEGTTKFERVTE